MDSPTRTNSENAMEIEENQTEEAVEIINNDSEPVGHDQADSHDIESASSRAPSPICEEKDERTESKKRLFEDDNEDDGTLCPICLDNWTNTGEHRICALKCGHLFGHKCVTRWLEEQSKKTCPTCKKKVNRSDIRFIYAKKLIAMDNSELEVVKKQLETVIEEKNRIMLDISKYICREHSLNEQIASLQKTVASLQSLKTGPKSVYRSNIVKLYMDKSLEVCSQAGCRVFEANSTLDTIMVSAKSPTNLFNGFGVRIYKFSLYKALHFIPLHTQQIRGVAYSIDNRVMLTASMDKTFKILDSHNNVVIHSNVQEMPLWSCCWDTNNPYNFYVGTQSGTVFVYDTRLLSIPKQDFAINGDRSPVVSIASIPAEPGGMPFGGVISCKLNSLWLFENQSTGCKTHPLPLEGPFVSMKYQKESKHLLVSSRPNNRVAHSRHTLCTLAETRNLYSCNVIHSFQGGGMQKLLSKSCFLDNEEQYVAAYQESSKCINLWSISTGNKASSVPAHESVLDLGGLQTCSGNFLISLTEKKLEFFKFH